MRTPVRAVREWARGAACVWAGFTISGVLACGDSENASFVEPTYADPCTYVTCSGHGSCDSSSGAPVCRCDATHAGELCASCAPLHHLDALGRCAPNRSCGDLDAPSCGAHGHCVDQSGVVECSCDRGYEGARCQLCSSGYERNQYAECLQVFLVNGGGSAPQLPERCRSETCHHHGSCTEPEGVVTCSCFPGYTGARCDLCAAGFSLRSERCVSNAPCTAGTCGACDNLSASPDVPTYPDTCGSTTSLDLTDVKLLSMQGDGKVWVCAGSRYYGMNTEHVVLEVGKRSPAQLTFRTPIIKLDFDAAGGVFSGPDIVKLEVQTNGKTITSLELHKRATEPVSVTFPSPVSEVDIVSSDRTTEIAIDGLSYQFDSTMCQSSEK